MQHRKSKESEVGKLEDRIAVGISARESLQRFRAMLIENQRRAWISEEEFASWVRDWQNIARFVDGEMQELKTERQMPLFVWREEQRR